MNKFLKAVTMFLGISAITLTLLVVAECYFKLGGSDSAIVYEER